jgi:hypothetical protein
MDIEPLRSAKACGQIGLDQCRAGPERTFVPRQAFKSSNVKMAAGLAG